jgi:hypothetical protein
MPARQPPRRGWSHDAAPVRRARRVQKRDPTLEAMRWGGAVHRQPNTSTPRLARPDGRVAAGPGGTCPPPQRRTRLLRQAHPPPRRDVQGHGTRRPSAGDGGYWRTRWARPPAGQPPVARRRQPQQGSCRAGGWPCPADAPIAVAHRLPQGPGGHETSDNGPRWPRPGPAGQTTQDRDRRGLEAPHHVAEEPDDANASRPVLQPSRGGDTPAEGSGHRYPDGTGRIGTRDANSRHDPEHHSREGYWRAGCEETRTSGSAGGWGKRSIATSPAAYPTVILVANPEYLQAARRDRPNHRRGSGRY